MSVFKSPLSVRFSLSAAALALTLGMSAPVQAQFAPTGAFSGAREANILNIVDVQARRPARQPRRVVRRGNNRGAAVAAGLVGAAIIGGALIASSNARAAPRPYLRPEYDYFVDQYGRRVDAYGRPIDKYGRLIHAPAPAPVYRPQPYYVEPQPYYYQPRPQPRPRVYVEPQVVYPAPVRPRYHRSAPPNSGSPYLDHPYR